MGDITLDDFPPDRLAEIAHWRNNPAVNRYLRQGTLTLEDVQEAEPAKFEAESATSGTHKSVALDAP
jgi:hypothetical protein